MSAPEWVKPGAKVVVVHPRNIGSPSLDDTIIDRVGKRDVVLVNGQRFSINRPTPDGGLFGPHRDAWSPTSRLYPKGHPAAVRAADQRAVSIRQAKARRLLDEADTHTNHGRFPEALASAEAAVAVLRRLSDSGRSAVSLLSLLCSVSLLTGLIIEGVGW